MLSRMAFIFFLSHHFSPMICDWGIFFLFSWPFIYVPYWFTVICDLDFFYFLKFVTRTSPSPFFIFLFFILKFSTMEKVFKIHVDLNLQTFFSSIFICILGGICLSCLPLNCHYHQIGLTLKQVVPVSYYDSSSSDPCY